MRAALLILGLLGMALVASASDGAVETLDYDHSRGLMADNKKCSTNPPQKRDYSWIGYKGMNGFAHKGYRAVGGMFKTVKNVSTVTRCFKLCVAARSPGSVCGSFAWHRTTRKCSLSTFGIPFDPTDPQDLKTSTRWCPEKGYISGWVVDEND